MLIINLLSAKNKRAASFTFMHSALARRYDATLASLYIYTPLPRHYSPFHSSRRHFTTAIVGLRKRQPYVGKYASVAERKNTIQK